MGNYDDGTGCGRDECGCAYVKERDKAEGDAGFAWTKAHTSEANTAWLRTLHPQIRFEADGKRYLLVHGSPRRINEYLYEDKPDETFARIAAGADADVIVCGHTHKPYDKTIAGTRFVNVGSAGKPKDGDPRACWALLDTAPTRSSSVGSPTTSRPRPGRSRRPTCPASSPPSCARRAATGEDRRPRPSRRDRRLGCALVRAGRRPPSPARLENGYRDYGETDLARLRLVASLRRLGLGPEDAGRLARLCLEHGEIDTDLVPVLAEQRAAISRQRQDLDRLEGELIDLEMTIVAAGRAKRKPTVPDRPIPVLFVCTHNSARSQIAEALLRDYGGADFEVSSAGTEVTQVNPYATRVLADLGIDWSGARSKSISEYLDQRFDYVITVCDRARRPVPCSRIRNTLHWGLDDPSEIEGTDDDQLAAFRHPAREIAACATVHRGRHAGRGSTSGPRGRCLTASLDDRPGTVLVTAPQPPPAVPGRGPGRTSRSAPRSRSRRREPPEWRRRPSRASAGRPPSSRRRPDR